MQTPEFLNQSSITKYPFTDDSSLTTNFPLGIDSLRKDFLLDISLTTDKEKIFLKKIHFSLTSIMLEFFSSIDDSLVATTSVSKVNFSPPQKVSINGVAGTFGEAIFGEGVNYYKFIATITFPKTRTKILPSLIRKNILANVKSINGLTGDIVLKPGFNTRLDIDPQRNVITINAIKGEGLGDFCGEECPEPDICQLSLKNISGVRPNENGNLDILGEQRAVVENFPQTNTIQLGTAIPIDRLNCTPRSATKGPTGPAGPTGPTGDKGADAEPICILAEQCITCDQCEVECGQCNTCEVCDTCETCDTAENPTTTTGG